MKEIEYKYLVDPVAWKDVEKPEPNRIVQGFIVRSVDKTIRVRIKNNRGFLTIKGKSEGIARDEFEYEIPLEEAEALLANYTDKQIIKNRYEIIVDGRTWEVDVFEGNLSGLLLAELEVASEDEKFTLPSWVTEDVSLDPSYYNAVLIDKA